MSCCFIQNIYNVESVSEFENLVTFCGWKLNRQDNLTICCWQTGANTNISPSVKGLIYNTHDGKIMAPGVHVPLETEPEDQAPVGYSMALDGVLFRFWYSEELQRFTWSTNGMITPGNWRGADLNFLIEQCIDGLGLVKIADLNRDLCYMAVLEHPDIPNLYQVFSPIVTLVRITNKAGVDMPLTTEGFNHVNMVKVDKPDFEAEADAGPAMKNTFGLIIHYANGDSFRKLSKNAQHADMFRPNYSSVWQHWIYHVLNTTPNMWDYGALHWYKTYFPWNANEIEGLSECFLSVVPPPEQEEILQSSTCLKRIVDIYKKILDNIEKGDWSFNADKTIDIPHLGSFADMDDAQRCVNWYMNRPARIWKRGI